MSENLSKEKEQEKQENINEQKNDETKNKDNLTQKQDVDTKKEEKEDKKFNVAKVQKKEDSKKIEKEKVNTNKTKKEVKKDENDKNKKPFGRIILILILLILIIAIIYVVMPSPEKALEGMFKNLKEGNFEKVNEYVNYAEIENITEENNNNIMLESEENQKLFYEALQWNIKSVKTEGNVATVTVEVTNKDFKEVISNYMEKAFQQWFLQGNLDEQKMQEYLVEELKSQDIPVKTQETTISLEKQNGKWKVKVDDNLKNALYPGLIEFIESIENG